MSGGDYLIAQETIGFPINHQKMLSLSCYKRVSDVLNASIHDNISSYEKKSWIKPS